MIDKEQEFKPYKKEEKIIVTISKREAVLLDKLRRYAYGKFEIHKANGVLIRIEIRDSQLIEEDAPINLE